MVSIFQGHLIVQKGFETPAIMATFQPTERRQSKSLEGLLQDIAHIASIHIPTGQSLVTQLLLAAGASGECSLCPSSHVLSYKKERKMTTGRKLAGCLGGSNDATENIAECIRGPVFALQSVLPLPPASVPSPAK